MNVEVRIYGVSCNINYLPTRLGAYPLILGRPQLRQVGAIENWRKEVITIHNKRGKAKQFDIQSKQEPEEESKEIVTEEGGSESSSDQISSKEDSEVSFLLTKPDTYLFQMEGIHEMKERVNWKIWIS